MKRYTVLHGRMVELADVPNAGVTRTDPDARSGNPNHDARSGKFGSGGKVKRRPPQPAANVDPLAHQRMLAAARDAAREFDTFGEGDIREFLAGRAQDPDAVDVEAFLALVRQEHLNDMADLLDQQFRSSGPMKQSRRKVRISAPKGYLRKAVRDLQPSEVDMLVNVIASRGHDEAEVRKFFDDKKIGTVELSDIVEFDPDLEERLELVDTMREAFASMPAPQVTVNVPEPQRRVIDHLIERDERNLVTRIRKVEDPA